MIVEGIMRQILLLAQLVETIKAAEGGGPTLYAIVVLAVTFALLWKLVGQPSIKLFAETHADRLAEQIVKRLREKRK